MRTCRITFIAVIATFVIAAAAIAAGADLPQVSLNPDHILKGTAPTITITLDKNIPNQQQISSVRIGKQAVAVQQPRTEGKLSVQLPKSDLVGRAEVEVIGKGDKAVAVGHLTYVEPAEQSSRGLGLLLLYVVLIVLRCLCHSRYTTSARATRSGPKFSTDCKDKAIHRRDQGPPRGHGPGAIRPHWAYARHCRGDANPCPGFCGIPPRRICAYGTPTLRSSC